MASVDDNTIIKVGPAGYSESDSEYPVVFWDGKGQTKITRIYISGGADEFSEYIQSFQYEYVEDGILKLSPIHGGQHNGCFFDTVSFSSAGEYITGLSGTYLNGEYNCYRVTSLTIETNVKIYEVFGTSSLEAQNFGFRFGPDNNFGGFYGTFSDEPDTALLSIGVYVKPSEQQHGWECL